MIEDQVSPKKCGHTRGKQVISREEARMKIRAAVDAARQCRHPDHGAHRCPRRRTASTRALARCEDFEAEGADIIFFEAPGDRGRDAPLLLGDDQAVHGQHGAGRQDAGAAAREAAGDRLQARALSGDAVVVGDLGHAGDARCVEARLEAGTTGGGLVHRPAGDRRLP